MNILLVDDNPDFLLMLKETLFLHGYNVYGATDGAEACKILTSPEIDLIISDIKMPKLDGIKLHSYARNTETYKRAKFMFVTGYREEYKDILKLDPEVDFFIDKTTPVAEIVKRVDELLFGSFAGIWI